MDNIEVKPNSHKSKEESKQLPTERKKVEPVVTGTVKTKKKNGMSKFASVFISEDAKNVKSYVLGDVLVPAIKKAVSDIVRDGIDMILYGSSGRSNKSSGSSKISYTRYYDRRDDDRRTVRANTNFDYDDIVFDNRGDVEAVREQLDEMIDRYGFATVADLYDAAHISAPYTAQKYGWTNIRSAEPVRLRDGGYILKLPKAMPID